MLDPFSTWSRVLAASNEFGRTGRQMTETLLAAQRVIDRRTHIMRAAARSPLDADYFELARMVPEKVEAFSKALSAMANEWWAMQAAIAEETAHLARVMLRGRPPTPDEWMTLSSRTLAHALSMLEHSVALGANAVAPIHARATANDRRLNHRRS